jgi:nitrite transporter NirC
MIESPVVEKVAASGVKKSRSLEDDPLRYVLRSILAGMYLTLVGFVFWSLMNNLGASPFGKVIASGFFGVGLSVIIFTNAELFTSNTMYMVVAGETVGIARTIKLWCYCWLGNLIGAMIVAGLLYAAGAISDMPANHALYAGAAHKAHQTAGVIFVKGILANWVVCLAVWVGMCVKDDVSKFMAIILVVFIFLYLSFEHSIANMGTFSISLLGQSQITLADAAFNLLFSTLGNIVGGGLLIGGVYRFLSPLQPAGALQTGQQPH